MLYWLICAMVLQIWPKDPRVCLANGKRNTHTHRHTNIPFYLWRSVGTRGTSIWYLPPLIYDMYRLVYEKPFSVNLLLLFHNRFCMDSGFNWILLLVSVTPVQWHVVCCCLLTTCCTMFCTFTWEMPNYCQLPSVQWEEREAYHSREAAALQKLNMRGFFLRIFWLNWQWNWITSQEAN